MDILFFVLEFAASYNCYTNLRLRMHQIPAERFPLNLLHQELAETCIYLDILQKTTTGLKIKGKLHETGVSQNRNILLVANDTTSLEQNKDKQLQGIAEEKLVSCRCFQRAIDWVVITVEGFQNHFI